MELKKLRDHPEYREQAAKWFSDKWGIPVQDYDESMKECIQQQRGIPQWYLVTSQQGEIIAGAGVIDNDFHQRKDLTPNLCALYVEENYRHQGIAKLILDFVRSDLKGFGFSKVYLVTDHTAFYEKCGWRFLTMVLGEDGIQERMYVATTNI